MKSNDPRPNSSVQNWLILGRNDNNWQNIANYNILIILAFKYTKKYFYRNKILLNLHKNNLFKVLNENIQRYN